MKDVFGLKIENDRKLSQLRESLLAALITPDEVAAVVVPVPKRRRAVKA